MEFRTVSTRLAIDEFTQVNNFCKKTDTTPSSLIRDLLFEEINQPVSNSSGRNIFEYDKKRDLFTWIVELDDGRQFIALKNISPTYLKELEIAISGCLTSRDELQGKSRKNSVPVPKKLLRVKK